jgi:hypothetical protein
LVAPLFPFLDYHTFLDDIEHFFVKNVRGINVFQGSKSLSILQ